MTKLSLLHRLIFIVTFVIGLAGMLGFPIALGEDFERQFKLLQGASEGRKKDLFSAWQQLIANNRNISELEKLRRINDFFNQHITYDDDISIFGKSDYWATPLETLSQGSGDCEDYVIAKYFSLLQLGVPVAKLRLVYVKARLEGIDGAFFQAHMVLAYYATPSADPLILDNLNPNIRPASQRKNLSPVFSFNSQGLWLGTGNRSSKSNLSRWQDLLLRARVEGFQ